MQGQEQPERQIDPAPGAMSGIPKKRGFFRRQRKIKGLSYEAKPRVMRGGANPKAQPVSEHFRELRRRLIYSIAALFLGGIVGFFIQEQLFNLIRRPLDEQLYYTTPTGGFNAIIKISIVFGVLLSVPVFVYHIGKFLSPAFNHRIGAVRIILFSVILSAFGVSFAYFVSLPAALHFLANIDSNNLQSLITVNEYINFVAAYLASFAILFQLPLVMLFINRIKPQQPRQLMGLQRWVVLVSFIIAAFLTPTPDPLNQLIMAVPIILLYQVSVILIWLINRRKVELPSAITEPEIIPSQIAIPVLAKQQVKNKHKPPLIMDVFWIPHNPAK